MRRAILLVGVSATVSLAVAQLSAACNYTTTATRYVGDLAGAAQQVEGDEFRWSRELAAGRVVEIKGVNGNVRAEPAAGGQVEVVATKRGRRSDPATVRVQVVEHGDGVTICAVYPSPDAGRPNTCEPGAGGRSNVRDNDVSVEFTVRVPAGVRFTGRTVNGNVEATSLAADAEAYTVNGSVRVSTSGLARAKTVNGSIDASMGAANWADELTFETVNGSINLSLPATTSAEVRAETVNGDVMTDFPVTVQGRIDRRIETDIGGGGKTVRVMTTNGPLEIRRR